MIDKNIFSYKTFFFSFIIHLILIFALLFSPVSRGRAKIKEMQYKVSLSYLPVKKAENNIKPEKVEKIKAKKIESEVIPNIPKKQIEKKSEGMKPLSGKREETFSKQEETISVQGTKLEGLDAPYFPFNYYLTQVLSFISSNWYKPPVPEETYCVIYFVISKSGRIIDAKVEKSSEYSVFDRAALRAVLASNPLPPLPFDFYEEKLGIHLRFQ